MKAMRFNASHTMLPAETVCAPHSRCHEETESSRKLSRLPIATANVIVFFLTALVLQAEPQFADPAQLVRRGPNTAPAVSANVVTNDSTRFNTNAISRVAPKSMDSLDDTYRLAIGDRISFRIVEDEEDPKTLVVTDSGELEIPYLGRWPSVGRTCKQLAGELKVELEKEYYYKATVLIAVDVMTRSRGKVYLVGAVRGAGPQDVPSDEVLTLSKAVLRAGGFTEYADQRNVKVTRKAANGSAQEQSFTVDVSKILEKGRMESDLPLEPGDLIYVPERLIRF